MLLEEFINQCVYCGYISGPNAKRRLRDWCMKHPKDIYTPEDFIEVYRDFQTLDITHEPTYSRKKEKENVIYIIPARGSDKGSTWDTICEHLAMGKAVAVKSDDGDYHWFYPDDYILD